ncbi:hypothetical protein CsSME_00018437 [Camellia sinensis var. sinensis]
MLILDSLIDKDKLPKSFILIQAEVLPHSRTLVPYLFISDSGISTNNLGLAEITSASRQGHVAPGLALRVFSAMHIVKNRLRNRMGDKWMNDSLVDYIERNIFDSVDNDTIMKNFQKMKTRRGQL